MPTLTLVPLLPLNNLKTSSFSSPVPAMVSPLTHIILSPERIPTLCDGPPDIGATTKIVSSSRLNSTPIPSKLPSIGSLTADKSLALI